VQAFYVKWDFKAEMALWKRYFSEAKFVRSRHSDGDT
jgi:hypothetical protein